MRKIDPAIETILRGYNLNPKEVLWDCHGTWCMYHRSIERVAADLGILFDPPQILEANGGGKCVALAVTGHYKDRAEWSIGEAAPGNNKNAYPYAMAEKRAKDRVVLKLIGLHGLVYSEDEMPNGGAAPAPAVEDASKQRFIEECRAVIAECEDDAALVEWWNSPEQKQARKDFELATEEVVALKDLVLAKREQLKGKAA